MPQGIHEEALRALVEGGAVRDTLVSRQEDKWTLAIRLGGAGSRWLAVRSRRETLRTWASLTAVGRFAEAVGLRGFSVEL
ncbi:MULTISPECIES: hypothetical protein [Pseudomonas]|uniref:Uncharacterized protein n=1 Tax=Pseudomonas proteolytica TaxID=219574 RepID=A0AAW5A6K6_9PSED|nr:MULTISPECIES: hypothetical protein [Pseudomonas]KAA8694000.1 hypothetical protein F4W61_29645 [Pseudomonas proteolytica]MCF5059572.1 hypothetical protein [Pseudomonas proteolytica]MCF5102829.1 hypothetical protein [Pseudomonas proteolytica]NMX70986.1 hypothetical protein [Pseudomonas sp. WS 5111]TWR69755.1 hypothetical protein FIV38_29640 [Pseudomonas proteolytica]